VSPVKRLGFSLLTIVPICSVCVRIVAAVTPSPLSLMSARELHDLVQRGVIDSSRAAAATSRPTSVGGRG
jgi:hypothetical protein